MTAPQTQHKSSIPLSDQTRTATGSSQWLLEAPEDEKTPIFHFNALDVYICGEHSFAKIADDICRATKTIDIIAWGFDPAMELTRGAGGTWPRGGRSAADTSTTYGSLLRAAAERGVKVRLLVWFDPLLHGAVGNMPGYRSKSRTDDTYARGADVALGAPASTRKDLSPRARREAFNANWYSDTAAGKIKGLFMRTRGSHHAEVVASLKAEADRNSTPRTILEILTIELAATHHQKTIVIDYDSTDPAAPPVGYVMGLNSVTDYWDTTSHGFNDIRRGRNDEGSAADHSAGKGWEARSSGQPTMKPYQDYVCRIEGEAIAAVQKNFVQAWDTARQDDACAGANDGRRVDLRNIPRNLTQHLLGPYQRAQIVRTLPDADSGERSIKRTYYQASSFARHYIYVENQYFQNTDWVRNLKAMRRKFVEDLGKGGLPVSQVPTLHVIAVTPTPERGQMVPRTHDVVTELGYGDSVPEQDKRIKQELARHDQYEKDLAAYTQRRRAHEAGRTDRALDSPYPEAPPSPPEPLSEIARAHKEAGGARASEDVRKELANTLGLRTLVCSLWAYDQDWSLANTPAGQKADREQRDYEKALRMRARFEADRAAAQSRNVAQGGWENHTDSAPPIPQPVDRSKELQQATARRYREVYIHSKLMIIDDAFFTLGSANLNLRSFAGDSEINIATDSRAKAADLRRRVWSQHRGELKDMDGGVSAVDEKVLKKAFELWELEANENFNNKKYGDALSCSLVKFFDERTSTVRFG